MAEWTVRRVLHVTEAFTGGLATYMCHLLPAQADLGLGVTLLYSPRKGQHAADAIASLERRRVSTAMLPIPPHLRPIRDSLAITALRKAIESYRPDVIHFHAFKAGFLGRVAASRRHRGAVLYSPHCFAFTRSSHRLANKALMLIERALSKRTGAYVFVSESERRIARSTQLVGGRADCVIPNPIPCGPLPLEQEKTALRIGLGLSARTPLVGMSSRLCRYKGVDQLLRACAMVTPQSPDVRFLVMGEGPLKSQLEITAERLGLGKKVSLLGYRPDAARLIQLCDLCVSCSVAEGMSYSLLEAMSGGVAIVASRVPGNEDLVQHEQTGLLYAQGQERELADAIIRLLHRPDDARRLGARGRAYVQSNHQVDATALKYVSCYDDLLRRAGSPGNKRGWVPENAVHCP